MSIAAAIAPRPVLIPVDPGYSIIVFQFVPTGLQEAWGSAFASASALGMPNPVLQFTRGEQKTVTFEARLFADNADVSVDVLLQRLKSAAQTDPLLRRPPIWVFSWGRQFDYQVVVESIGGIKYDTLRQDGSLRGVSLQITLKRYESFAPFVGSDPDAREHNTFYRAVQEGDLWETLAERQYGDPLLGEFVRRQNPSQPTPSLGTTVALPDREKIQDIPLAPDSIPLARTADGIAARRTIFNLRNVKKVSTILTKA
jgi:hypothetical protein